MIIFFSIGAAFGAHALLRQQSEGRLVPVRLVTTTVIWPIVLFQILVSYFASSGDGLFPAERTQPYENVDTKLRTLQKSLETELLSDSQDFPLFVWRDVISRYTGLSIALMYHNSDKEFGLTPINGYAPDSNQAVCLGRRNLRLLEKHRTLAREDLIELIQRILSNLEEQEPALIRIKQYLKSLNDQVAILKVAEIYKNLEQIDDVKSVTAVEQRPWIPQEQ